MVIDTNVAVVANGEADQAGPRCRLNCIAKLSEIRDECRVLLDNSNLIFEEYRNILSFSGQPGLGDAFLQVAV